MKMLKVFKAGGTNDVGEPIEYRTKVYRVINHKYKACKGGQDVHWEKRVVKNTFWVMSLDNSGYVSKELQS